MSWSSRLVRGLVVCSVLLVVVSVAQAEVGNEKALKYHSVLVKRPTPGYLYDRFFNTWLDTGTLEGLQQFLESQVDENNATADRLLLAFFHAKQGDDVRALQQFRTALSKDAQNGQAWYQKAVVEARTLDFDTAIADLEKAGQANTDEELASDIAKLLGKLYVRNHQSEKAVETWKSLLKRNPGDEDLYEDIIELQIGEGLYEQAAALSDELVARTKDKYKQVIRRVRTGDIHQRAGKRSQALEVYASTLEQVGHGSWIEREILAQIEQMFRREDDLLGLRAEYDKLLGSYSKRVQIRKNYAKLLSELGEVEEAQKQFQEILRLTPGDRKNSEAYVTLLADSGKTTDALTVIQTLIDQHPKDSELRLRQATLQHGAGDTESASKSINKYLEVSDKSEYAFLRAARMLQQFELPDDAEKTYQRLTEAFPESVAAKEAQAAFLYGRDKKDEALAIWKSLAAGQDRSQVVRVARILSTRNEHQAAFEMLRARYEDFRNDPIFLGQIVTEAIAVEEFEDALPWARRRVQLAKTSSDLDTAISQVVRVAKRADSTDQLILSLKDAERSTNETCLLAELYERRGDSRSAEQTLRQIEDQQDPIVANQQIRLYTQRQDWSKAIAALQRLVQLPEGRKSIYIRRLVELYQREFKYDEALAWVQQWKKLSPGSTLPWLTQSRILVQQDKLDEAIGVLRSAVRQFDGDQDVRARLAVLYSESGKLADAERIFWRLYDDGKDLTSKLRWVQNLAETAELQGKTRQLIDKFEERRRTNRQSIEPLLALAEIHRVSSDYEERRKVLLEAARIKGDDLRLLRQIARIEESEGDWERALATLQRAAALDSTTKTKEQIARLYLNYDDPDKGYAILYEIVGDTKSDARSLESIAQAMMSVKDWERAAEFLAPRIRQHPDDYRIRYLLGIAQEEAALYSQAIETFAALLTDQKEIPGNVGSKPPALPWAGFLAPLESLMPSESLQYLELGFLHNLVYGHRAGSGRYPGSFYGAHQGQPAILVPHNVDSARKYSLVHLLEIGGEVDQSQLEDVKQAIRGKGVGNVEVLTAIGDEIDDEETINELAEQYPNDEGLMGLLVVMNMNGESINTELLGKAYEMFKRNRPQLALMVATQLAAVDSSQTKMLDEAMKSLDEIKKPNLFLVMSLAASLGGGYDGDGSSELADKYKQEITKRLVDWYPSLTNMGPQGSMVFEFVASAVSQADDATSYLKFLDEEVSRWRDSGQKVYQSMTPFSVYNDEDSLLLPLEFPPDTLSNFPPHVSEVIPGGVAREFGRTAPGLYELTPEQLAKIQDPTLRILMAAGQGHEQVIDETLKKMLEVEQPELDALLLAASKATSDGNVHQAMQLLDKARFLPMGHEVRKRVDAAMVAMALNSGAGVLAGETKPKSVIDPSVPDDKQPAKDQLALALDLGQKAALRLRRVNLDSEERLRLVGALEELGLNSEAEKLVNTIASSPSTSPHRHYSSSAQPDRVTKLLNDGKQDQAMRMIVNDLRATAREVLLSFDPEFDHEARQLGLVVQSHGLAKKVLAEMDPGDAGNLQKLGQYAVACELLDQRDKAKAAYERALIIRPKEDAIRIRLILLQAEEDIDAALVQLKKCDPGITDQVGYALINLLEAESNLENAVKIINALNKFVAELDDPEKYDLSWLVLAATSIAETKWTGRPLYLNERQSEGMPDKRQGESLAMQTKAHNDLCRTMLKIPQLAHDGFSRLLSVAERDGKVGEEFVRLARESLVSGEGNSAQAYYGSHSYGYGYVEEMPVLFKSPCEFLARHVWKSNNPELVTESIVPELKNAKKLDAARALEGELSLYTSDNDTFLDVCRKYHAEAAKNSYESVDDTALSKIIAIWDERKLTADINPLIDESVKKLAGSDDYYSSPEFLLEYASTLKKRGDAKQLERFFGNLTETYLGPKEEREARVKQYYESESRLSRKSRQKIRQCTELMEVFARQPEFFFTSLGIMDENGLLADLDNVHYYLQQMLRIDPDEYYSSEPFGAKEDFNSDGSESSVNVDLVLQVLDSSPFLSDIGKLRVFEIPGDYVSVMGHALLLLRDIDEESRAKICKHLEESKQKEFGRRLIVTYLSSKSEKTAEAVLELLAEHLRILLAQPESKQREIASLTSALLEHYPPQEPTLSEDAKRVNAWMVNLNEGDRNVLIERILAAESWKDIEDMSLLRNSSLVEEIAAAFQSEGLLESDRAKAKRVVLKLASLLDDRKLQRKGYDKNHIVGEVIDGLLRNASELGGSALVIDLLLDDQLAGLNMRGWWVHRIANSVESAFRQAMEANEAEDQRELSAMKSLYATLGEYFQSHSTTILAEVYGRRLGQLSIEERVLFITWAEAEAKAGNYPKLAIELAAAARTHGDESEKAAARDYYMRVMQDKQLPVSWRFVVAESFLPDPEALQADSDSRAVVLQCARLLQERLTEKDADEVSSVEILQALLKLEQDDSWRTTVTSLVEAWNSKHLRTGGRSQSYAYAYGYGDAEEDPELAIMLKLNLMFQNEAAVTKMLRDYGEQVGRHQQTFGLLIRHGRHSLAAKLLRNDWDGLTVSVDSPNESDDPFGPKQLICQYDRKLHDSIPEFLATISQEDLRYLAQIVISTLPDIRDESQQAPQLFDARIKALAAGFAKVDFSSPARKEKALELLATNRDAAAMVQEPLSELAKNINLAAVLGLENQYVRDRKLTLVKSFLRASIAKGDYHPVAAVLEQMANAKDILADSWYGENPIAELVAAEISERLAVATEEELTAILPVTLQLAAASFSNYDNHNRYTSLAMVAHALAAKIDDLNKWRSGIREPRLGLYPLNLSNSVWQLAATVLGDPDKSNLQRRIDVAAQILKSSVAKDALQWFDGQVVNTQANNIQFSYAIIERSALFSNEEFLEHGHKIAAAAPVGGMTWAALAQRQLTAGQHEAAIDSWTKAIAALPKDVTHLQTNWRMHQADLLARFGRAEEARNLLEDFDRSLMHAPSKKSFDALLERIKNSK